jgi:hypothetical protein
MSAGVIVCEPRPTGLPAAAIRIGRMLETWGRRAARPLDREDVRHAQVRAQAIAEHEAAADRARLLRMF